MKEINELNEIRILTIQNLYKKTIQEELQYNCQKAISLAKRILLNITMDEQIIRGIMEFQINMFESGLKEYTDEIKQANLVFFSVSILMAYDNYITSK